MNLVRLVETAVNGFGYQCVSCHKYRDSQKHGGYADLDGKAFHSFYCKECGDACSGSVQGMRESPPATKEPKVS